MNLYQLRYFATLARLEHYTQAAAELNITQPSLSHAIGALERELGVTLFERVGRNVALTREGRLFRQEVEKALDILDRGVEHLREISRGQDIINLGFLRGMGGTLVPEAVSAFQRTEGGKQVEFRFFTDNTKGLLDGLEARKYDLVFCSQEEDSRVTFELVYSAPYFLTVPEGHPLAQRERVRLEETLDDPHIIFAQTAGIRPDIDRLYARLPRQPKIAYVIQEDQDIAGLVAHRFGVAVLPPMALLNSLPVRAIPLESGDIQRRIYLASVKGRYLSPAAQAFRRFVRDFRQKQGEK